MTAIVNVDTSIKLESMSIYIDPNVLILNYLQLFSNAKIFKGVQINSSCLGCYSYVSKGSNILNCRIGAYASVGNMGSAGFPAHPTQWVSTHPFPFMNYLPRTACWPTPQSFDFSSKQIIIGNDVWIGANVLIMGGVKINDGAIVAAGSVVTKDVPRYAIVGGNPAKVLKYRFSDTTIESLLKLEWWMYNWPDFNKLGKYIDWSCVELAIDQINELIDLGKLHHYLLPLSSKVLIPKSAINSIDVVDFESGYFTVI